MNKQVKFNPVFDALKPSSTLFVNEMVNKLWQQGEQVFHMGFGESRFDVHPQLENALGEHANKKSYLPARGLPALTEVVANYYSNKLALNFGSAQVIIGPGSKSLIYALQMVLDADLFLPSPSWVSYAPQAHLLSRKSFYIPASPDDNYRLDIQALDKLVQASTNSCKMLVLNSPNNPTGEVLSAEFLQELANYCRTNKLLVMSDEIYFQLCHGDVEHTSIAKYYPEGTLVLGGLSKHMSVGGWRLGVGLFPNSEFGQELMKKMVVFASETWSGVAAPIQYAAITAYSLDPQLEEYVDDCRCIHALRTDFIRRALIKLGLQCTGGQGAFYTTVNFANYKSDLAHVGVKTSSELAKYLLKHYRIASLPCADFGLPEQVLSLRLSTSYLDMEGESDPKRIFSVYKKSQHQEDFMSVEHHPMVHKALQTFEQFLADIQV